MGWLLPELVWKISTFVDIRGQCRMKQVCQQWNRVIKVDLGPNGHELKKMYRNWCQSRDEYDQRLLYYKATPAFTT